MCATPSAQIFYSTDGKPPDDSSAAAAVTSGRKVRVAARSSPLLPSTRAPSFLALLTPAPAPLPACRGRCGPRCLAARFQRFASQVVLPRSAQLQAMAVAPDMRPSPTVTFVGPSVQHKTATLPASAASDAAEARLQP